MLTRLGIFVCALIVLPLLAGLLADALPAWHTFPSMPQAPLLAVLAAALGLLWLSDRWQGRHTGQRLLRLQRTYFLALAVASALLGWLLAYLNLFSESWLVPHTHGFFSGLLQTACFALLIPLVLNLRTAFLAQASWLKLLAGLPALPWRAHPAGAYILLTLALAGLTVGSVWPTVAFWWLWLAPLVLLAGLQWLWHESTVFDGITRGDWGRIISGAASGLIVGNLLTFAYALGGGTLIIQVPNAAFMQLGYALFGLLCLQLADIIAEAWRGKSRAELFSRKPFPVSVVVKK